MQIPEKAVSATPCPGNSILTLFFARSHITDTVFAISNERQSGAARFV
jgi:hypothetical protein